jgi:predicted acetyltransferase
MMDALHADMVERGDVVGGLTASEGGIYERFGYGVASSQRMVEIDRVRARVRPDVDQPGDVSYVPPDRVRDVMLKHWDRYRRTCPGELSRSEAWTDRLLELRNKPTDGLSPAFVLAHPDGYASYRIKESWNDGKPSHRLEVMELAACSPSAHAALWSVLLSVDLVGTVAKRGLALDDPLPLLLTNQRLVRTTDLNDGLWLRPLDAVVLLATRSYGTADRLVVALEDTGERIVVDGSPEGAEARRARTRPDLTCTRAALGALLLGGVRASYLAAGGRIVEERAGALRRADAFFQADRLPLLQTHF